MTIHKLVVTTLLAAAPVLGSAAMLDFEEPSSFESILSFYAGGADGAGVMGPDLGVVFGGDALALRNDALGPYFSNAPTPVGVMTPVGAEATMDVAIGFVSALGFAYSSSDAVTAAVQVWSGLGGTGNLLASFDLMANAQAGGCSDSAYCNFDSVSLAFAGVARSVTFGAAAGYAAFDNLSITAVPEPTSALLMALGCAGLLAARRRG
jgi:PEP-CTERM motif